MQDKALRPLLLCCLLFLAACGSPSYKVTLKDGREFYTKNKPEYSPKTGYYRFRAPDGKDALIRADEILMMKEQ